MFMHKVNTAMLRATFRVGSIRGGCALNRPDHRSMCVRSWLIRVIHNVKWFCD